MLPRLALHLGFGCRPPRYDRLGFRNPNFRLYSSHIGQKETGQTRSAPKTGIPLPRIHLEVLLLGNSYNVQKDRPHFDLIFPCPIRGPPLSYGRLCDADSLRGAHYDISSFPDCHPQQIGGYVFAHVHAHCLLRDILLGADQRD